MDGRGESWAALEAARAGLAARDADLASTDEVLADHLREAHRVAVDCIRRIEAIRCDIESAVAARHTDSAAAAREMARFLLSATGELKDIVAEARSAAFIKAVAMQRLMDFYRP